MSAAKIADGILAWGTRVVSVSTITCPVCGAPLAPDDKRCGYCGSYVFITSDHGFINPASLNRQLIDQKIADFRATLRRDSKDAMAHYGLGLAYFNLQLWEEAADELKLAARLMPENAHIQYQYAVVLVDLAERGNNKMWAEAQERLDRAVRLKPDYVDALLLKGTLANLTGDFAAAYSFWSAAYEADPDVARAPYIASLIKRAENYRVENNPAATVDTFRQIATIDDGIARKQLRQFLSEHSRFVPHKIITGQDVPGGFGGKNWLKSLGAALGAFLVWVVVMLVVVGLLASAGKHNSIIEVFAVILMLAYFIGWVAIPTLAFRYVWRRTPAAVHDTSVPAQIVTRREILNGETSTPVMLLAAGEVASKLARDARAAAGKPLMDQTVPLRRG